MVEPTPEGTDSEECPLCKLARWEDGLRDHFLDHYEEKKKGDN